MSPKGSWVEARTGALQSIGRTPHRRAFAENARRLMSSI
jgi:hypothetical protein